MISGIRARFKLPGTGSLLYSVALLKLTTALHYTLLVSGPHLSTSPCLLSVNGIKVQLKENGIVW